MNIHEQHEHRVLPFSQMMFLLKTAEIYGVSEDNALGPFVEVRSMEGHLGKTCLPGLLPSWVSMVISSNLATELPQFCWVNRVNE